MAGNTGKGYRKGSVKKRIQAYNRKNNIWIKIDTEHGGIIAAKSGKPFKGVAHVVDDRRS